MLLDSNNEDDEEINSEGEAFVEDKCFQFTEQETPVRSYAVTKVLKEKRHQILLHMETLMFGS